MTINMTAIQLFYSSKEPAAYTMFSSREERDEEGEREQLKQQQEERLKRNQEWRAR